MPATVSDRELPIVLTMRRHAQEDASTSSSTKKAILPSAAPSAASSPGTLPDACECATQTGNAVVSAERRAQSRVAMAVSRHATTTSESGVLCAVGPLEHPVSNSVRPRLEIISLVASCLTSHTAPWLYPEPERSSILSLIRREGAFNHCHSPPAKNVK